MLDIAEAKLDHVRDWSEINQLLRNDNCEYFTRRIDVNVSSYSYVNDKLFAVHFINARRSTPVEF